MANKRKWVIGGFVLIPLFLIFFIPIGVKAFRLGNRKKEVLYTSTEKVSAKEVRVRFPHTQLQSIKNYEFSYTIRKTTFRRFLWPVSTRDTLRIDLLEKDL